MGLTGWVSSSRGRVGAVAVLLAVLLVVASGYVGYQLGSGPAPPSAPPTSEVATAPIVDTFSMARGDSLGLWRSELDQEWRQIGGTWEASGGLARAQARDGAAIATLDPQGSLRYVQVTVGRLGPGAGVAFRYEDPSNYWSLLAAPLTGRWTLVKVVAGEQTILESYGPASTSPGTTVMLRFDGDRIEVEVDGVGIGGLSDSDLQDQNRAGFVVPAGTRASFDQIIGS